MFDQFAKTLEVHRKGLLRADIADSAAGAEAFVHGGAEIEDESTDETDVEKLIQEEEDQAAEAAGAIAAGVTDLALVDEMLEIARKYAHRPDARIGRLVLWNTPAVTRGQGRSSIMGAVAMLFLMIVTTPSAQAEGSWCANYSGNGGTNCGFYSFQQCMAAVSGAGGFCTQNGFSGYQNYPRTRTRR